MNLPCKIGDRVFVLRRYGGKRYRPVEGVVSAMFYDNEMQLRITVKSLRYAGMWGETVFATREEAERCAGKRI